MKYIENISNISFMNVSNYLDGFGHIEKIYISIIYITYARQLFVLNIY